MGKWVTFYILFVISFLHGFEGKATCEKLMADNLTAVELYLQNVIQNEAITKVDPTGIYFKTIQKGTGSQQITDKDAPLLTIDIYELDAEGKEKFSFTIGPAKKIRLETCLEALRKGVTGMVVGEKRRIFAHPKFTHGELGFYAPEHYVVFEVEAIATGT